jgi:Iron-containing redox enzyme
MSMSSAEIRPDMVSTPRSSDVLRKKIEFAIPVLWAASDRLWESPDISLRYPEYLQVMHQIVRATVPVMYAAIRRCEELGDDPVAEGVLRYLRSHVHEEKGHDDWVKQDLQYIRDDADELLSTMPSPAVADAVGAQYYWVLHHHPVCLLGHIAVLEGYPPSSELAGRLVIRTGFSRRAFRTLNAHAVLDQRHRDDLLAAIDQLPISPGQQTMLGVSALHTISAMARVFDELASRPLLPVAGTTRGQHDR